MKVKIAVVVTIILAVIAGLYIQADKGIISQSELQKEGK